MVTQLNHAFFLLSCASYSLGRSPIFSHTNATISGLATIRTFKSHDVVIQEFNSLQNSNTSVCFLFNSLSRALALWLEVICVFYMAIVLLIFFVFEKGKLKIFMKKRDTFSISNEIVWRQKCLIDSLKINV